MATEAIVRKCEEFAWNNCPKRTGGEGNAKTKHEGSGADTKGSGLYRCLLRHEVQDAWPAAKGPGEERVKNLFLRLLSFRTIQRKSFLPSFQAWNSDDYCLTSWKCILVCSWSTAR
ncbi:MAG: hypothetical protein ABIF10_07855 [Candidatus Woesearchaeota archaeon]